MTLDSSIHSYIVCVLYFAHKKIQFLDFFGEVGYWILYGNNELLIVSSYNKTVKIENAWGRKDNTVFTNHHL